MLWPRNEGIFSSHFTLNPFGTWCLFKAHTAHEMYFASICGICEIWANPGMVFQLIRGTVESSRKIKINMERGRGVNVELAIYYWCFANSGRGLFLFIQESFRYCITKRTINGVLYFSTFLRQIKFIESKLFSAILRYFSHSFIVRNCVSSVNLSLPELFFSQPSLQKIYY